MQLIVAVISAAAEIVAALFSRLLRNRSANSEPRSHDESVSAADHSYVTSQRMEGSPGGHQAGRDIIINNPVSTSPSPAGVAPNLRITPNPNGDGVAVPYSLLVKAEGRSAKVEATIKVEGIESWPTRTVYAKWDDSNIRSTRIPKCGEKRLDLASVEGVGQNGHRYDVPYIAPPDHDVDERPETASSAVWFVGPSLEHTTEKPRPIFDLEFTTTPDLANSPIRRRYTIEYDGLTEHAIE